MLTQIGKPVEVAALIVIFATTVFLYRIGARDVASVSAICLIATAANLPNRLRQIESRRRRKEILNR
jgi:hypothetical protein